MFNEYMWQNLLQRFFRVIFLRIVSLLYKKYRLKEIRASYWNAALSLHPDKLLNTSDSSSSDQTSAERFLKVHKAWEILSDSTTHLFYDKELQSSWQEDLSTSEVAEDLSLHDMTAEIAGKTLKLFYPCRRSDYFSVYLLKLQKMGYSLLRDGSSVSILYTQCWCFTRISDFSLWIVFVESSACTQYGW